MSTELEEMYNKYLETHISESVLYIDNDIPGLMQEIENFTSSIKENYPLHKFDLKNMAIYHDTQRECFELCYRAIK